LKAKRKAEEIVERNMLHKSLLILASAALLAFLAAQRCNAQSDAKALSVEGGATLFADLETSLDSKKAKAEEKVAVRVIETLKIQDRVIFPKGTQIVGRVTQASARGKGDPDSLLIIQFEKAVLKGGEEVPVRLAIKAMAPPRHMQTGDSPGLDPLAGTHAGTMTSPMGNGRQGSTVDRNAGGAGDANAGSNDVDQLTTESRGVYGMSGLRLQADVSRPVPVSIVSSNGKNVRLDSGTRLALISIADVPVSPKQ
jgi:hypothetical protein